MWGPYPEGRIAGFVAERRVGPATPLSPWASGPFQPAAANPEFTPLFTAAEAPAPSGTAAEPRTQRTGAAALALAPRAAASPEARGGA